MFNDRSSLARHLATRRSGKPRDMVPPGPTAEELDAMIALAARTPDHGKLAPWRFVVIEDRIAFAALLDRAYRAANPDARDGQIEAALGMARDGEALVIVVSAPVLPHKIPLWEQQLSAGAATMNLLHAAHGMGFVAGWLTGWPAYDPMVKATFAPEDEERIAGLVYIGSPGRPLEERPRPELDSVRSRWPATA